MENEISRQENEIKSSLKDIESSETRAENIILAEWNSLPKSFETMKKLALALLTLFGSSYSCEEFFSNEFYKIKYQESPLSRYECCRCQAENYKL